MSLAPRLEVFTQLSCNNLYGHHQWNHTQSTISNLSSSPNIVNIPLFASVDPLGPHIHSYTFLPERGVPNPNYQVDAGTDSNSDDTEDPRRVPSAQCLSDPAVQAGAARLQTIMITGTGLLSALTTSWWGHFGERHGRTRVLALSTLGLFLTDLMFILVSTPSSPLSKHGHNFLLVSPITEGLLGSHLTVQAATSAYLSDCTSSGSRAKIFSRFTGVFALGFCLGPAIAGWLILHPMKWLGGPLTPGRQTVTSVFLVVILCSFINFLLMAFVLPESLNKEKRERAMVAYQKTGATSGKKGKGRERALTLSSGVPDSSITDEEDTVEEANRPRQEERERSGCTGAISRFLSPLAVFLPVVVLDSSSLGRKRRDWSLTLLAVALFAHMLSTGIYQIKYLYAQHTYEWGAEQLSYYISLMGGSRAMFLLFLLPTIISFFKPKPPPLSDQKGKGKPPALSKSTKSSNKYKRTSIMVHQPQQQQPLQEGKQPKLTRAQLDQEISFDLLLARFSLMIDILSYTLVILFPAPVLNVNNLGNHMSLIQTADGQMSYEKSEAMFVVASSLSAMGSGIVPVVHSLALCMLQVRALQSTSADVDASIVGYTKEGAGALFGAFAVLQAVGQMILGPMIYGLVYSGTVAKFPKAIFAISVFFLVCASAMVLCVRNPARPGWRSKGKKNREGRDVERGRSRVSKDLRGGAIIVNHGSDGSNDSASGSA
ncbi:hypothetical protein BYT27DRAFT_7190702 [Phlegmacium glaucopus]|nr:hypothetical protein BYT27DRAFT_7190702 [Phlegmacium glaucopus]